MRKSEFVGFNRDNPIRFLLLKAPKESGLSRTCPTKNNLTNVLLVFKYLVVFRFYKAGFKEFESSSALAAPIVSAFRNLNSD